MEKKKKEKEIIISAFGIAKFDGNITLKIQGKNYKLRTDYCGFGLKRASQKHSIVMLLKQHMDYNELDTGFLVRSKAYDMERMFGLKARKSDRTWSIYHYSDVVAWGYIDGGLNSDHFASCQMRPEDYPQFAGEPADDDWTDNEGVCRRGVKFCVKDGEVTYLANEPADEPTTGNATQLMRDAAASFTAFRKIHPEVTEIDYYTDEKLSVPAD